MALFPHLPALYGALHPAVVFATVKKTTSSSGSSFIFILLIVALGGYLLFGPQRKRRKQQVELARQVSVGDEVVTTAGIVGRVEWLSDDRAHLTIAPGTTIEVLRGAIARRIDPVVPPSEEVAGAAGYENGSEDHPGGDAEDSEPEGNA